jgi:hypothetical protein
MQIPLVNTADCMDMTAPSVFWLNGFICKVTHVSFHLKNGNMCTCTHLDWEMFVLEQTSSCMDAKIKLSSPILALLYQRAA